MNAKNQFFLRASPEGEISFFVNGHSLSLSLEDAYEFQYTLAASLAEIELEAGFPDDEEYDETREHLQEMACHHFRKFDA